MSTPPPGRERPVQDGPDQGLKARLQSDLTASMRARDQLRTRTLRSLLTAVRTAEVSGRDARQLEEEEVVGVLRSEAKRRREGASAFSDAGRGDRAEVERAEEAVVESYLPTQLDDEALVAVVAEEVARAGAEGRTGMAAMGSVMGAVRPRVGQQAEGGRVAAEVRRQLGR